MRKKHGAAGARMKDGERMPFGLARGGGLLRSHARSRRASSRRGGDNRYAPKAYQYWRSRRVSRGVCSHDRTVAAPGTALHLRGQQTAPTGSTPHARRGVLSGFLQRAP